MQISCKKIFTSIIRLLLSHIGVLTIITVYLIGGGWLFVFLEAENEIQGCSDSMGIYINKLNETTTRAVMVGQAGYNTSILLEHVVLMLNDFARNVYQLQISPDLNCSTLGMSGNVQKWSLANSIFFCATLITTVGYGNIAPLTTWGKISCIVYSFIGIPIMLIFLSNLGEVLANGFRFVYLNMCCCRCFLKHQMEPEVDLSNECLNMDINFTSIESNKSNVIQSKGPPKMIIVNEQETETDDPQIVSVPIIVIVSFLALYMLSGAALFRIWETWDFVSGMYFAFITVATIGLGDMYPTKDKPMSTHMTIELLAAAMYCLFGLAALSMSFSLIQDEISIKLQWLGDKIGLNPHEDEMLKECDSADFVDNTTKPLIINKPLTVSVDHTNEAYDDEEMDPEEEYNDEYSAGLYPKLV